MTERTGALAIGLSGAAQKPGPATPRLLRTLNDRSALELLAERGPLSRSQIGRLTGLSKPTASQLLARLESAELVEAIGIQEGRPGRSPVMYRLNPRAGCAGALDVTSARIVAGIVDLAGNEIARHELTTGRGSLDAVANVAAALDAAAMSAGLSRTDIDSVVIGTPGSFDPATGRLQYAKHLAGWHSPALVSELAAACGTEVRVENDVNLAALAEQRVGAAVGCADFFLFWADEGLGGALMLDNRLYRGATGGAGEVGFMQGTGPDLVRHVRRENSGGFQRYAGPQETVPLAREFGLRGRNARAVVSRAAELARNPASERPAGSATRAVEFLDELATRYAAGLSSIIALVDPAIVVLGGGVMTAGGEELRGRIASELALLAMARPSVVLSTVPDNPVLVGGLGAALDLAREAVFATG